jgi:hypothetical protein
MLPRLVTFLLPIGLLVAPVVAQTSSPSPSQLPFQAKAVSGVLVPIPRKVFETLDKFRGANWSAVQRPEIAHWKSHGDEVQVALLLGASVAEGVIAMEAKDSTEVHDLGNSVLRLTRGLGVEESALRRSRSIMDYADRHEWPAARREWDAVISDLERGMIGLKSEPLSQLVSLAGWLRGTEALCSLVLQNYSPDRAELIRQPALLDYLEKQLVAMKGDRPRRHVIIKMLNGLRQIRVLLENDKEPLSAKTVREIGSICTELVDISSRRPA